MTIALVALAIFAGTLGFALFMWGLCCAAALGDQVQVADDSERCPVCGDPTGVRCCEFGKAA